ncbi:unnamed protein product [Vicia faba]|uniref:Reverse transcriptase domain-containing protein n=1 Tax=Vicia faba TaxID=3906 RepID=A0AAV1ARU5_VICFA|nr:unnamed protein product [Vicia faba]
MYRALSKLLMARLKKVLHSIVSICQSTFVSGRQMLDGVLVANKVVDFTNKEGNSRLLFKVNFEKVYDNVSWGLLSFMMRRMGFSEIWMRWMEVMIFTSKISVLVNGYQGIFGREVVEAGRSIISFPFCARCRRFIGFG